MRLLVIRHGLAGDRDEFAFTGRPDAERPLTKEGRARMKRAASGLRLIVEELSLVATSPLVRSLQTAEIVAEAFGLTETRTVEELAPERSPDDLLPWLRTQEADTTVAVVGHNPHLGFLVGWLLTGRHENFVELKKGAAAMLHFEDPDPPAPGCATLLWSLAPSHLRKLRKEK
ncbi:MAG: phosphohistidine phosphatase SixA [Longimicrobiaceae bacterium]